MVFLGSSTNQHGPHVILNSPVPEGPEAPGDDEDMDVPRNIPLQASIWSGNHDDEKWRFYGCPMPHWSALRLHPRWRDDPGFFVQLTKRESGKLDIYSATTSPPRFDSRLGDSWSEDAPPGVLKKNALPQWPRSAPAEVLDSAAAASLTFE